MYISTFATIILAASPMISAINYRGYTSTTSCSGSAFGCSDGGAVCCGGMPAGTKCWNGGGKRATNLNWFHSAGKRIKARSLEDNENCSPHFFSYEDAEGSMREVKVNDAEHAVVLADLYQNGNFSALQKVEEYKH
ncbi:MAG: hypothetical protein Q9186_001260 [Xanthomendoza sp. 1 TL-2023]